MMDPDETYDADGWLGVCPVCGNEIMGDVVLVGIGDRDDQWAHSECARKDEDDDCTNRNKYKLLRI